MNQILNKNINDLKEENEKNNNIINEEINKNKNSSLMKDNKR